MKDLFISMGESVSVRNFVEGDVRYRQLEADEVLPLIERVRAQGGKVQGCFEFGSMPSEKKRREFHELRAAFKSMTGAALTTDDFLARAEEEEGETLPNFNFIPAVTDEMSMLAVEYYFVQAPEAKSFDDMFSVCDTGMRFHFFERPLDQ